MNILAFIAAWVALVVALAFGLSRLSSSNNCIGLYLPNNATATVQNAKVVHDNRKCSTNIYVSN